MIHSSNITPATTLIGSFSAINVLGDPISSCKYANFRQAKFDLHVKVTVNAPAFTAGRVIVVWTPFNTFMEVDRQLKTTQTIMTSYPYAELDIGAGESVSMVIPYSHVNPVMNINPLTAEECAWSQFQVHMLSPLSSGDTVTTANITIYASIMNLYLSVPYYQSGVIDMVAESAVMTKNIFDSISSRRHPLRSHRLKSDHRTGWATKLIDVASSALGDSRPPNSSSNTYISNLPMRGFTHGSDVDDSVTLGVLPDNQVVNSTFSNYDPLDIYAFTSRYQLFDDIEWAKTTPGDSILVSWPTVPGATSYYDTRLGYMADMFNYYRGGLIYRFSIVKTPFFSGRLSIEFSSDGFLTPSFTVANPSVIWDVRTSKEIEVRVPYVQSWRLSLPAGTPYSNIGIRVVNPLTAPDGSPSSVRILCYVAAADDISFCLPRATTRTYLQSGNPLADVEPAPPDNRPTDKVFDLMPKMRGSDFSEESFTMGEGYTSLRPVIKRSVAFATTSDQVFRLNPSSFSSISTAFPFHALSYYYKFWRGSVRYKIVMRRPPRDSAGLSPAQFVLESRLQTIISTTGISPVSAAPGTTTNYAITPSHITYPMLNPVHEITVPYFSRNDRRICGSSTLAYSDVYPTVLVTADYDVLVYTTPPVFDIYMSIGEDFDFLFLAGSRTAT